MSSADDDDDDDAWKPSLDFMAISAGVLTQVLKDHDDVELVLPTVPGVVRRECIEPMRTTSNVQLLEDLAEPYEDDAESVGRGTSEAICHDGSGCGGEHLVHMGDVPDEVDASSNSCRWSHSHSSAETQCGMRRRSRSLSMLPLNVVPDVPPSPLTRRCDAQDAIGQSPVHCAVDIGDGRLDSRTPSAEGWFGTCGISTMLQWCCMTSTQEQ